MKRFKKILAMLSAAAMLTLSASAGRVQVQADTTALAVRYNSDAYHPAYATEVEDQAQSSYCWAYMADAVLESYLLKTAKATQPDFSESDMISQLSSGTHAFSNLNMGGNYHQAVAYWTRGSQYGPRLESDSRLTDYYVGETIELGRYQIGDALSKQVYIQNIKNLTAQYGAVGVSIYFDEAGRQLTTKDGAYFCPQESRTSVNHGVVVVGWDDDFMPQWFQNIRTTPQQPGSKGAFLVKNSWGKNDPTSIGGNTGYYWVSYENYFQDAFAVTQVVDRSGLYDYIYETDYRGLYEYISGDSYSQTYQLSSSGQLLTGFATYVKAGAHYRFFVNGQELTQLESTMAYSGYRTFQLSSPMSVYGTSLEIRVEVSGAQDAVPIAAAADSYTAEPGNACLKAFTKSVYHTPASGSTSVNPAATPAQPNTSSVVTQVMLSPQECTISRGSSQVFSVQVIGSGQPSQQIDWQLSGSSSPNTKLSNGILYIGADEASSILYVYANSRADNTKSAACRITVEKNGAASSGAGSSTINPGNGTSAGTGSSTINPGNGTSAGTGSTSSGTGSSTSGGTGGGNNTSGQNAAINGVVQVGTVDKGIYTCLPDGTALYGKCVDKTLTSVSIPATVKIGGRTYDVISLDKKCLCKNKKMTTLTIGKNVIEIGNNAFNGCSKLKKIKIKSSQLEFIGYDALKGISSKAVIYVPRSCLSEYRTIIRESGNSKVRVRAYD